MAAAASLIIKIVSVLTSTTRKAVHKVRKVVRSNRLWSLPTTTASKKPRSERTRPRTTIPPSRGTMMAR